LLSRDFGPYGIIFMNVCVVITVAMEMLLRAFGQYGIIFIMCNKSVALCPQSRGTHAFIESLDLT
jgi:hypothetical protein